MKIRLKNVQLIGYILNILILIIEVILLLSNWDSRPFTQNWASIPGMLAIIALGLNILFILQKKVSLFDFRFVFVILAYVFMFGRVWLAQFNVENLASWSVHRFYDPSILYKTSLFALCSIQFLFIGLFSGFRSEENCTFENFYTYTEAEKTHLYNTGVILLIIAVPCRLYTDLFAIISAGATGYYVSIGSITGLWDDFAFLIIPAVLCIAESKESLRRPIIFSVIIYFIVVMSLTGDRRYYVSGILALMMYYLNGHAKKRIKLSRLIIYGLLAIVFLNLLELIREARNGDLGSIMSFATRYGIKILDFSNVATLTLGEFGLSFYSLASIIEHVPNLLPFQYGLTFLRALPSILPFGDSFGFLGIASPSAVVNQYTRLPLGGTLFGDLYANFGLFAIIAAYFSGLIIRKYFVNLSNGKSELSCVLYYTSYYILINLVRCTVYEVVRPIVWCTLIPICIYKIMNRK